MIKRHIYIVGSGIIGLAIAEYFSRKDKVTIISNENPLSGSYAAAANLATKGQLFGRDPHFQMKINGKKIYPLWLKNLLQENSQPEENINLIFKTGLGVDIFCNQIDRDKHLKRVLQNKDELLSKNLPTDSIIPQEDNEIIYKNESWVDAHLLLNLLKTNLYKRGVNFYIQNFSKKNLNEILSSAKTLTDLDIEEKVVIFCTGVWTKELLINLELPLPPGFNKPERMTIGSTLLFHEIYNPIIDNYVLYEKIGPNLKGKVTLSGNRINQYFSSTSIKMQSNLKLENIETSLYKLNLQEKNEELIALAKSVYHVQAKNEHEERVGLRVGYGHSEILIENVAPINQNTKIIVCCGAHKSGFLFAPILGEKIEKKFL